MQIVSNPRLLNTLVEALSLGFLEEMARSVPALYAEAIAEVSASPILEDAEASYLLPHMRRAYFEANFRKVARKNALVAMVKPTRNDTATYSMIKAGNVIFTASHVSSPGAHVRNAAFRSERALLNDLLDQVDFIGFDTPKEDRVDDGAIYCIVLYGEISGSNIPFMQFAFPEPETAGYVDIYTFDEVLVAARGRSIIQAPNLIDTAFPKPKTQPKEGEGT